MFLKHKEHENGVRALRSSEVAADPKNPSPIKLRVSVVRVEYRAGPKDCGVQHQTG